MLYNQLKSIMIFFLFGSFLMNPLLASKDVNTDHESSTLDTVKETIKDLITNEPAEEHKKHEEHESSEAYIILFVILCLVSGVICKEIKKSTNIPYSPQLLVIGLILGSYYQQLGDISTSIQMVIDINPHGILYIFIPTIIFESAYNIDPFIFKKEFMQVNILATIGVIIGSLIIGFGFREFLGYYDEFSWSLCFTFSAIISATDPVAVVALLKELGTSKKFNTLLEGESLLNDGTAAVFYLMFSNIYKGLNSGVISVIWSFIRLAFGGVAVGAIVCAVIVYQLKKIIKDDIQTLAYTFIGCYFAFFVSEFYLGVSGIIAIVTLGVLMGKYGKVNINPESDHAIHAVWSFVQHSLETILFIITGIFIGKNLLADPLSTINQNDIIRVFLFFILMTAARYLMIFSLKDLINQFGWPIGQKDIVVLTYGGLRGAIALALSLLVTIDNSYTNRFQDIVLFYTTSMIFMTILFNGLTMKYVIRKIGFQPEPEIKKKIKESLEKQMIVETYQQRSKILSNKFLKLIDWEKVLETSGIKQDVDEIKRRQEKILKIRELEMRSGLSEPFVGNKVDLIIETRVRFYQLLKQEIWNHFEESLCSATTVRELNELIDLTMEETNRPVWIWECVADEFLNLEKLRWYLEWKDIFMIGYFIKKKIINEVLHNYELLSILVYSLKNIEKTKKQLPINIDYIKMVFGEVQINLKQCEQNLFNFIELFPDLAQAIQEKNAAKMLLNTQKQILDELLHDGSITDNEHADLRYKIDKRIKYLEISVPPNNLQKIDELLLFCPIFKQVTQQQFDQIISQRTYQKYGKDDVILHKDKMASGIYCIKKGTVIEFYTTQNDNNTQGMGSILSFGNLINPTGNALTTIQAQSDVEMIYIPNQTIIHLMNQNPEFNEKVYRTSVLDLYKTVVTSDLQLNDVKMQYIIDRSEYREFEKDTYIELKEGGFLFSGKIKQDSQDHVYKDVCFIPPNKEDYQTLTEVKLLKFSVSVSTGIQEESLRVSQKMSFHRDSFASMANLDNDVDRLFNHIQNKIIR